MLKVGGRDDHVNSDIAAELREEHSVDDSKATQGPSLGTAAPRKGTPKSPASAGKARRRRVRIAEGVYKDQHGIAATVKVNGIQREIRFPHGTSLKTIRARRDELRASLRTLPRGEKKTLAYDAERYLKHVSKDLVGIKVRAQHIQQWVRNFGHLSTLTLSHHIRALNERLRDWHQQLSPSTCNSRRDSLTNLVKVLYGRRAAADLVDLIRFKRTKPKPRWLERSHVTDVLAKITPGCATEVRLRLMHWTGMRPSQMGRLQREDFRLDERPPFVAVPRGKGGRLAAIPLVGEGLRAARDFVALNAFGPWSTNAANITLRRAAKLAQRDPFTVYQIRHTFASGLRRTGTDVADIQDLYGHTDPETTMIYAPPQLEKHVAALKRLRDADEAENDGQGMTRPSGRVPRTTIAARN